MKIKHRLALIVLLPLAILLGFVGMNISELLRERGNAIQTQSNIEAATVVGELIHSLQVERGLSGGYLVSLGDTFSNELVAARDNTDKSFEAYIALTAAIAAVAPKEILEINQDFSRMDSIRSQVNSLQIDRADMGKFYTGKINSLLDLSATLISMSVNGGKSETANAYLTIKRAKEAAGLERKVGAQGLGMGTMSTGDLKRFVSLESFQDAYLTAARGPLAPALQVRIDAIIDERETSPVSQMRNSISRLAQSGTSGGLTAPKWFAASTDRINQIHEIEKEIGLELVAFAEERAATATNGLMTMGLMSLLVTMISSGFAFLQSRQIVKPLTRFVGSLEKIAGEDYDFELSDSERRDEIGDFARALSEVKTNLKAAAGTQRENRFKGTAFASANTPMFVVDEKFVVTYTNDASDHMFADKAALLRTGDSSFDPGKVLGARLEVFSKKLGSQMNRLGDASALPMEVEMPFGEHRISVQIAGIFDDDGNHLGNVISWDDVTVERTNQGKLNAIDMSQAVIEFEIDGTITNANEGFLNALGYSLNEVVGKHHSTFVGQDRDSLAENRQFWKELGAGEAKRGEFKRYGKGGKEVWIFATYSPILDENGVPFKVVKFASDITEEKAKRAEVSSQLDAIQKAQAVIEFDLNGNILHANDNFLETMGYTSAEIQGKHHRMFVPEHTHSSSDYQAFWQTLREGVSVTDRFERIGAGGRRVWLRASYNPILNEEGKPARVMKIANDITESVEERNKAEAIQKRQSEELETVITCLSVGLNDLSQGDLTTRITDEFAEQYEKLKIDFNRAIEQLNTLIQSVAQGTGGISSNAREITQAADDLSQRTESQAATLEETAAALEQLTASVKSASEGAKRANEVVANAKGKAEASEEVVQRAVSAMDEIEKSSSQISQIIGVIDDIAFQTNLLALNAGVEAARAGEAGRGFAVVASEVRALAQRSSDAAKEIKGLISASSQHVESGVELVDRAGEALKQILSSVGDINELVAEIAGSSDEQSIGISEINTAVNQMDQSTQQNAAMVEQTTAACHAMSQETAEVVELVSKFKIGGETDADAAWLRAEAQSGSEQAAGSSVTFKSRKSATATSPSSQSSKNVDDAGWQDF